MVAHGIYTRLNGTGLPVLDSLHEVVKHSRWCPSGLSLSTVFPILLDVKIYFYWERREREEKEERGEGGREEERREVKGY